MKNKWWKNLICVLVVIAIVVCAVIPMGKVFERKYSVAKNGEFISRKENYDVLFLGSSHTYCAAHPMQLWNDYGIASYNLGQPMGHTPESYWILKNALDYTTPKVVVVDCHLISENIKSSYLVEHLHWAFDMFPLSINKIKAIMFLSDDAAQEEYAATHGTQVGDRSALGLLWDFSAFHGRWDELEENDFNPKTLNEKGAESKIGLVRSEFVPSEYDNVPELDNIGTEYLRKIIELCQDNNIEVIMTYYPYPIADEIQIESAQAQAIADEYDVEYLNFYNLDVVDYKTDMYDMASHVNISGARKITDYIGEKLSKDYGVADHRNDGEYSKWHEDYNEYLAYEKQNYVDQTDFISYLVELAGDDVEATIQFNSESALEVQTVQELLINLGVDDDELTEDKLADIKQIEIKKDEKAKVYTKADLDKLDTTLTEWEMTVQGDAARISVYRNGELIDQPTFVFFASKDYGFVNVVQVLRNGAYVEIVEKDKDAFSGM